MRLTNVRVRGFRSLRDLDVQISPYTSLVGANGTGKSSLLYALDWFFNGGTLQDEDAHQLSDGDFCDEIEVEVTFADLDAEDRRVLERYGRGPVARFRRTWSRSAGAEKLLGNARQGPGFSAIRAPGASANDMKDLYRDLRTTLPSLGAASTKADILNQLEIWEADLANESQLVDVDGEVATHMFGIDGEHSLSRRIRFVLIPASTDISSEIGSAGRGTALADLVGNLMREAVTTARTTWEAAYKTELQLLEESIRIGIEDATRFQADRVNAKLSEFIPGTRIEFSATPPSWNPREDTSIKTEVVGDGRRTDVSREGHGTQRAVLIAMLQAIIPDEILVRRDLDVDNALSPDELSDLVAEELAKLPKVVIGIEEPEIYQHPVRARSFARVLCRLSEEYCQVILATHSPYFVLPEQFESIRRFRLSGSESEVSLTSIGEIVSNSSCTEFQIRRAVERELPRKFSEGFFADGVVLVEGPTDCVVFDKVSERIGSPFDGRSIAVIEVESKSRLAVPFAILTSLGIPVYIVLDADSLKGSRHLPDTSKANSVDEVHRRELENLLSWLPTGTLVSGLRTPYQFGDQTLVTERFTIFQDDLEAELSQWPSFVAEIAGMASTLARKDVADFRVAVMSAEISDIPTTLCDVIKAAIKGCV